MCRSAGRTQQPAAKAEAPGADAKPVHAPDAEEAVRRALGADSAPHDITAVQDSQRRLHVAPQHGRGSIAGDWQRYPAGAEHLHQHMPHSHMHASGRDPDADHMPARERFYSREAFHVQEHGAALHREHRPEHYTGMHEGDRFATRQLHDPRHPQRPEQYPGDRPMHHFSGDAAEQQQHRGRHLMAVGNEAQHSQGPLPVSQEVLLSMPHRRLRQEHDLPAHGRQLPADGDPERQGQPVPEDQQEQQPVHGSDISAARREQEAAIAAQQQRFAEAQRAIAQREAEARHQQQLRQQAASQAQQQQLAAQQQQAAQQAHQAAAGKAPDSQGSAPGTNEATQPADPPANPPPPAHPPPAPRNPPPPPRGPVTAITHQMTPADFLRPETIETLFYLWRATGGSAWALQTTQSTDRLLAATPPCTQPVLEGRFWPTLHLLCCGGWPQVTRSTESGAGTCSGHLSAGHAVRRAVTPQSPMSTR